MKRRQTKKIQKRIKRFFKEASKYFGVEIAFLGKNADNYWREIKFLSLRVLVFCEELFMSDYIKEVLVPSFGFRSDKADCYCV